jgi:hypothetical protein
MIERNFSTTNKSCPAHSNPQQIADTMKATGRDLQKRKKEDR